uniref:Galanin peptides n=1 Tax=Neovison vison TaxID=452646 RepID=A0A8C7EQ63_NEOVI
MPQDSLLRLLCCLPDPRLPLGAGACLPLGSPDQHPVKEKRGWTLNSAGYLLGPHAIDNHRSLHEKPGLAGKRELPPEDETRPGGFAGSPAENAAMRTIIEFLTFLHLKEAGALEDLPDLPDLLPTVPAEDEQP